MAPAEQRSWSMPDIARQPVADLKPLDLGLSLEVLDWVSELRAIWATTGMSINRFALLHTINKGTVSRYLNGHRIPGSHWFLDTLLAVQAANGKPVTAAVRAHLTSLQLRALKAAHPHEYRIRLVRDELLIAHTGRLEAEGYACALEVQLAALKHQIQELTEDRGRLRADWDADRVAMQAEYERLTREIGEITRQLHLASRRAARAERRCQQLEDQLHQLDGYIPADNEDKTDTRFPRHSSSTASIPAPDEIRFLDPRIMRQQMIEDPFSRIDLLYGNPVVRELMDALVPHFCNSADLLLLERLITGEPPTVQPNWSIPLRRIAVRHDREDPAWEAAFPTREILSFPDRSPYFRCIDTHAPVLETPISKAQATEIAAACRRKSVAELLSGTSMLMLPLVVNGTMQGFFTCTRHEGFRPFDAYDVVIGREFVSRAAIFFDNPRPSAARVSTHMSPG